MSGILYPQRVLLRRAASSQPHEQPAYSSRTPVHRTRSTRNSVLIVAGSAGTGAAIGALAGGGKGAAISALAGPGPRGSSTTV
ncbi:MAG: hypothetical protein DMG70_28725 [Acidobacteria bacterium]|nr:MAG: hypothetical protein DMG70_28725 [Acidobacteriota bacterium]PYY10125.1 MAG: hypothetical protein DMG69_07655 [Acidobacteriota bacterium]